MSFESLELISPLLKALEQEGYTTPTPIQKQAIPVVLKRRDILGCAQTGTGKTAAFALPILQILSTSTYGTKASKKIKSLILTPTRELALQIHESFMHYGAFLELKSAVIFGGVSQHGQVEALRKGVDILVATPGRLLDLIQQKYIHLDAIDIFVLDEADQMLDMGFIHDIKKIVALLPRERQSLFFSATMPSNIVKLSSTILTDPVSVAVTPVSSTAEKVSQVVYMVDKDNKHALLLHLLENPSIEQILIFTRTKHGANKVVKFLDKHSILAEAIHGNKSQSARQNALQRFKDKEIRCLIATDIAARGIDIDDLLYVLNFDIPNISETYVHRIGRTGRAGASGQAISFCCGEEKLDLVLIEKLIRTEIPVEVEGNPYPMSNRPHLEEQKKQVWTKTKPKRSSSTSNNSGRNRTPQNEKPTSYPKFPKPNGKRID